MTENINHLQHNKKFIETVKIFAIYGVILSIAAFVVDVIVTTVAWSGYFVGPYHGYHYGFNVFELIPVIIGAAIGSAVVGVLFFFLYEPVRNWIKKNKFVSAYINSIFTLFWVPIIVVIALNTLSALSQPFGLTGIGLIAIALSVVLHLVIYYYYAKAISAKLASHYSWH